MDQLKKNKDLQQQLCDQSLLDQFSDRLDNSHQLQFLTDYNYCCLCGNELIYTHATNFISLEVKEEAYCGGCNIRTKQQEHRLQ